MCVSFARNKYKKAEILFIPYPWDSRNAPFYGDSVYKLKSLACRFVQAIFPPFPIFVQKLPPLGGLAL